MQMEFSTSTVAEIIGASVRMVDYWARESVLRPTGCDAAGKGSRRRWTFADIVALQAIRELRKGGCPLQTIRKVARHLKAHYPDNTQTEVLARLKLITDGKTVLIPSDDNQAMEVLSRQSVFSIPIGAMILETSRRVDAMPQRWQESAIIGGRAFKLDVSRVNPTTPYIAQCRQLPGAISESCSPDTAINHLKESIASFLTLTKKQRTRTRMAVAHGSTHA
jgi:DNA-binding transcriptional MerR regulator